MELYFTLQTIAETAAQFITLAANNKVIALHGEMGAGKTTFVDALCHALGVNDQVSSPTYTIINQYQTANGEIIYHLDLYRLRNEEEAIQAGAEDCLYTGSWCFVEWPEKAPGIFPDNTLHITLSTVEINRRKLLINL